MSVLPQRDNFLLCYDQRVIGSVKSLEHLEIRLLDFRPWFLLNFNPNLPENL